MVGYIVHHYCLRLVSGVIVLCCSLLYCPPLLLKVARVVRIEVGHIVHHYCLMFVRRMIRGEVSYIVHFPVKCIVLFCFVIHAY